MKELEKKLEKLFTEYDIFDDYVFYDTFGKFSDVEDYIKLVKMDLEGFLLYLIDILKIDILKNEDREPNFNLARDIKEILEEIERLVK